MPPRSRPFSNACGACGTTCSAFSSGLLHSDAVLSVPGSHELRLRYRPMRRVGICVPGGAAAYPSTLLMTVVPAQAAGVGEIAVVMPPTPAGAYNRDLLAAPCRELGVREVYRVGGAQAVAAMAYGVAGLPAVDMIVGPGNLFVTLAKKFVFGQVAIDCLAGPSEVVVLADETASPTFVAADLLAQAEHDPATSILITWHEPLLAEVLAALSRQLATLPRAAQAKSSLEHFGAIVLARTQDEAVEWTNRIGPEHLHIQTQGRELLIAAHDRQRRSDFPRLSFAGGAWRLRCGPVARLAHRRNGALRKRPDRQRLPAAGQACSITTKKRGWSNWRPTSSCWRPRRD